MLCACWADSGVPPPTGSPSLEWRKPTSLSQTLTHGNPRHLTGETERKKKKVSVYSGRFSCESTIKLCSYLFTLMSFILETTFGTNPHSILIISQAIFHFNTHYNCHRIFFSYCFMNLGIFCFFFFICSKRIYQQKKQSFLFTLTDNYKFSDEHILKAIHLIDMPFYLR